MKTFLLKAKHFFKRNIYPITVTACTALVLGIIAVSAYSSIKASNEEIQVNTPPIEDGTHISDGDDKKPNEDDTTHTSNPEVIIFDLPFENAKITKEYAEDTLLKDNTTGVWCTHQGLDFACNEKQEIKAIFDGTVSKVENSMMNGTVVYVKITDELTVVYKGLSSDVKVQEGDTVKKGQVIGTATTMLAEKADGVHLHLELLKKQELTDPTEYFSTSK